MYRVCLYLLIFTTLSAVSFAGIDPENLIDFRGDANNDKSVNNTDVIFISNYLYNGGPTPPCMNQADVNDDGAVNGSDPVYLSNWLFSDGPPPPAPGPYNPYCDADLTTPNPGCLEYECS